MNPVFATRVDISYIYTCRQVPPETRYIPWDQVHPRGTRYIPPGLGTPQGTRYTPRPGTPSDQVHPPRPGTPHPPEQRKLGDTGNKRAVRILLECILVIFKLLRKQKFLSTFPSFNINSTSNLLRTNRFRFQFCSM